MLCVLSAALLGHAHAAGCHVQEVNYKGWAARELSNASVKLTFVPQLGGRLMQVEFDGHSYLFVNPQFAGKDISPESASGKWINYGGDKIWPMPEGSQDEDHWVLESGALDDGVYSFRVVDQGAVCTVELKGPPDTITGLAYTRQISIAADSSAIHFHASMQNTTGHTLHWSEQSVTQYELASTRSMSGANKSFKAYTQVNQSSIFPERFYVRSGLADDPSFTVKDGLFELHWLYLSNEVWIDSAGGWLAVNDEETGFGMMERFNYEPGASYPGNATVIFYKNGPSVHFDMDGTPSLTSQAPLQAPYYMEAEINSPLVTLAPGASYSMETTWFPLRLAPGVKKTTEAGVVTGRLQAKQNAQSLQLAGEFGVVTTGHLEARIYDHNGRDVEHLAMGAVSPSHSVEVKQTFTVKYPASRVALHLVDGSGKDRGPLDEARVDGSEQGATHDVE